MRWINRLRAQTVIVHTREGSSLQGVMVGAYRDCLVLQHAQFLTADTVQPVDGEAVVPREQVAWIQRPGSAS